MLRAVDSASVRGLVRCVMLFVVITARLAVAAPTGTPSLAVPIAGAIAVAAASSVGAMALTLGTSALCAEVIGTPRPLCLTAGVALGGAVQVLLSWLLIPELFRWSGLDAGPIREGWWQLARWPLIGLAAAVAGLAIASGVEQSRFTSGQVPMLVALGGSLTSGLTIDVLGIVGAVRAAREGATVRCVTGSLECAP